METSQIIALGIFTSYFLIIIALFVIILRSLPTPRPSAGKVKIWTFRFLTLASLMHTWFYMFKFMFWSFANFEDTIVIPKAPLPERITSWLMNTSLFEQAWAAVCFGSVNWWWSEQLCLYTVGAWTVFLATEGRSQKIKHLWAYMILGQLVAISVASNLLYLALVLSQTQRNPPSKKALPPTLAPPGLWIPIVVSLGTIAITPYTSERTFLPNLLLMHILLVVPLLSAPPSSSTPKKNALRIRTLFLLIITASLAMRFRTILVALSSISLRGGGLSPRALFSAAWETLHSHPAQSSIGWDIVWTSISLVAWVLARPGASKFIDTLYVVLATPLASVGVTAPWVLSPRRRVKGE